MFTETDKQHQCEVGRSGNCDTEPTGGLILRLIMFAHSIFCNHVNIKANGVH